uniref:Putative wrp salivary protein n=1 Tax=Corethrella appendiculata TaxID=1370023 RepID=U5ESC1_9DIPT
MKRFSIVSILIVFAILIRNSEQDLDFVTSGPMCIMNQAHGEYLYLNRDEIFDTDRRYARTARDTNLLSGSQVWYIERNDDGSVKIRNRDYNEYLYAPSNDFAYDNERRNVFAWQRKGEAVIEGDWWLDFFNDNSISIRSKTYDEYMYAAGDGFASRTTRPVFTWRDRNQQVSQGYWFMRRC